MSERSETRAAVRVRLLTGTAALGSAFLVAGCGLPTDSSPRDIPPEFALDAVPSTVAPVVPSATGPRAYFLSGPPGTARHAAARSRGRWTPTASSSPSSTA